MRSPLVGGVRSAGPSAARQQRDCRTLERLQVKRSESREVRNKEVPPTSDGTGGTVTT